MLPTLPALDLLCKVPHLFHAVLESSMPGGLRYNIRREGFDVGSSRRHDFLLAGLGCQTEVNSGGFNVV